MNKRFNVSTNAILSTVIDKIEDSLECPKFKEYSNFIDIDTWDNIREQMVRNRDVAENGFGFCISNFYEFGQFNRIIVINLANCEKVNFTDREIASIIFHELGHLLNKPELDKVPTVMDHVLNGVEYNQELADKVREKNSLNMELYADSYATQFGYGMELVSTFYKQNFHFNQKIGFFEERVKEIKKNKIFKGIDASIDRKEW